MSRAPEAALILAILFSPWPYGSALESAQYGLAALLLLGCGSALLAQGQAPFAEPRLLVPAIALPLVAALQLTLRLSAAPISTAEALLLLAASCSTLLTVREWAAANGAGAYRFAFAVLASCAAQAGFGAMQWSIARNKIYGREHTSISMPFGSFVNHNHFAGFVEMGALLALGLAVGHARRARTLTPLSLGLGGLCLALATATMASQSRGGMVALTAGTLACVGLFVATRRDSTGLRTRSLLLVLGAIAVIGFSLLAVPSAARKRLGTVSRGASDSSSSYRIDLAAATLRLAAAHPIAGSGLGAFDDAIPPFKRDHGSMRATHAESDALEFLAEAGLLGIAAAAGLGLALWRETAAHFSRSRDPWRKGLAIGAASGAVALLIHSLVDFNLRIPSNALAFVVLLAIAAAAPSPPCASVGLRSATPRRLLGALLVMLSGLAAWRGCGAAMYERVNVGRGPNTRIEELDRVLAWHPYLAEAWRARALAWRELGTVATPLRQRRLAQATHDLDAALRLRPHWGEAWADRGWILAMRGRLPEARADLRRALELDPSHSGIQRFAAALEQAR